MSELVRFAKSELRRAGLFDETADYSGDVGVQVTALMETYCAYGHSGGSAEATIGLFILLANHKPITPLTGEDDEWQDVPVEGRAVWQNKRCHTVFKDNEGHVWDSANHDRPVTFPYTVA